MNPQMQNPAPGKANGTQLSERHKNSTAINYSSCYVLSQASDGKNNYSSDYHNTQVFLASYSDQRLTDAIILLEEAGYYGDTALFMLGWLGGAV
jgi:hypothetical protein